MGEINIPERPVYKRDVAIRRVGGSSTSFEITIPREVIRKNARDFDLSIGEITDKLQARIIYNDFGGLFIEFIKRFSVEEAED